MFLIELRSGCGVLFWSSDISLRGGEVASLAASTPGLTSTLAGTGWILLLWKLVPFLVARWHTIAVF